VKVPTPPPAQYEFDVCDKTLEPFPRVAVKGVTLYPMTNGTDVILNATVYVINGVVFCADNITCDGFIDPDAVVYQLYGAVATPGFINIGAPIGQVEVSQEPDASDGRVIAADGSLVHAVDGIQFQLYKARHMRAAWASGVTTVIVGPVSNNLVSGVGVAFHTVGNYMDEQTFNLSNLIKAHSSLHINVGNDAKKSQHPLAGSISGQMAALRSILADKTSDPIYQQLYNGDIPLVVSVSQSDQIVSVIRLRDAVNPNIRLVFVGAAESWIVKDLLANTANVSIILNDITVQPPKGSFETWYANPQAATILRNASIPIAFSISSGGTVRNLRWAAGQAVAEGLPYIDALAAITRTPGQMFFGPNSNAGTIRVGAPANFVVFNGDPLSFESHVELVFVRGLTSCKPSQL